MHLGTADLLNALVGLRAIHCASFSLWRLSAVQKWGPWGPWGLPTVQAIHCASYPLCKLSTAGALHCASGGRGHRAPVDSLGGGEVCGCRPKIQSPGLLMLSMRVVMLSKRVLMLSMRVVMLGMRVRHLDCGQCSVARACRPNHLHMC